MRLLVVFREYLSLKILRVSLFNNKKQHNQGGCMPEVSKNILWTVEYGFKDVESCDVVVIPCLDFRFRWQTAQFVRKRLGFNTFDLTGLPGASNGINKKSETAMSCFSIPCDLHNVKTVVVVHHQDCGAYGGSEMFENSKEEQMFHEKELRQSREEILTQYPDREVILIYARLNKSKSKIQFVLVS